MEQNGPLQFGPYVVLEQIGTGGMGAVYRARDRRLERDVAIKVLHRHLEMVGARERFLREARAVSSLNHPNISTIFDIGEQDGDPYLVMELLHGKSLKERLVDGAAVSASELELIAVQAAQALAAAHAKGIVHRDIKPANLFLVNGPHGEKQLKVLDFGLAKMESDRVLYGDKGGLTRTGSTVGTVEYMSPEQARGEDLDARSDLFSLGAVLYELATGDVPFRGATSAVVFAELLGNDPVPPRTHNSHVSPAMDAVIRKLLEKKRENRIQSAKALLEDLKTASEAATAAPVLAARPSASAITAAPPMTVAAPITGASPVTTPPTKAPGPSNNPPKHIVPVPEPTVRGPRIKPSGSRPSELYKRGSGGRPSMVREAPPTRESVATKLHATAPPSTEEEATGASRWWMAALAVLLLAGAGAILYFRPKAVMAPAVVALSGSLQVTQFDNATGELALQEAPAVAMQILLQETPSLHLAGYAPAADTVELDASELARRSGSEAYLTGSISRDGERYRIHAEILKTADGSRLAQEDADAATMTELPGAFSRLAAALRAHLGESPAQAGAIQLASEATASLPALALYSRGASLLRSGQALAAIEQFNKALVEDPGFPTARLGLVEALRQSGAEPERRRAALALAPLAPQVGICEKARIGYETADAANVLDAAQAWAKHCPNQADAEIAVSRQLLAAGRSAAAEAAGNRAVALDPPGRAAITASTEAMIAQGHFESAQKQQARAATASASSPGLILLAAYLRGDVAAESEVATLAEISPSWQDQWNFVTYLSNRGRLAEAARFGAAVASRVEVQPDVASTAILMRTRVAAMQAMAGHCEEGGVLGDGAGDLAQFYAEIASAWCRHAPETTDPGDANLTMIARAAALWSSGNPQEALNILQSTHPGVEAPMAAMLRAESHLALKQQVLAIGDYKAVLSGRGAAVLTGTIVYPAAQAGLATAYHTMGDELNATRVADDLKMLWTDASPGEPLLKRAQKR